MLPLGVGLYDSDHGINGTDRFRRRNDDEKRRGGGGRGEERSRRTRKKGKGMKEKKEEAKTMTGRVMRDIDFRFNLKILCKMFPFSSSY